MEFEGAVAPQTGRLLLHGAVILQRDQGENGMPLAKLLVVASVLALMLGNSHAQQSGHAFVGIWSSNIANTGDVRMTITKVASNGQVEGRMEFSGQGYTSTFADKPDREMKTNLGIINGSKLTIDTAVGGKYELSLDGDRLVGRYTRGGARPFEAAVSFKKS
jgi:hypothetical protein